MTEQTTRTAYRSCSLCEATCGLEITLRGDDIISVRGDAQDVFSRGFICPKGASIGALQEDPDRLTEPLIKDPDGTHRVVTWDEAFQRAETGLRAVIDTYGGSSVAMYSGNPSAHSLGPIFYGRVLAKALGTPHFYSASTVDQFPKQVAAAHMFGSYLTIPVPDLDRTQHLLVIGANPFASNGSLMTAPNVRGRIRAIQDRGGKVVVVDPRNTATAKAADEHHFIRPGSDAFLLLGLINTIFSEGLADLAHLSDHVNGLDEVAGIVTDFTPEVVAVPTRIEAQTIRRIAREFAAAPSAAAYGRFGTTTQRFGTATSWLIDVLNVVTGNLDRPGGAMLPWPAAGSPASKGTPGRGRGGIPPVKARSRVRDLPQVFGEMPAACLAEEIDTPGEGQVKGLITIGGNPVLSTPNGDRLDAAADHLEFMVSVDFYLNETTRHADVILPPPGPLQKSHYELILLGFAVRDTANFSPPTIAKPAEMPAEWEVILRLAAIASGMGANADLEAFDTMIATFAVQRETQTPGSPIEGADPAQVMEVLMPRTGVERLLDLQLRTGPYGTGFPELDRPGPGELCLDLLEQQPHGVDLGPLRPHVPDALRTVSGKVELAPAELISETERIRDALAPGTEGEPEMLLIGRRDLRSNNSWMHNLPKLVSGPPRCTAQINPADAARLGLLDGAQALIRSRVGEITVPVQVTADVMAGVVSVPHGWGHTGTGTSQRVAEAHAGVNVNRLTDEMAMDLLGGTAVLCGVPVQVEATG